MFKVRCVFFIENKVYFNKLFVFYFFILFYLYKFGLLVYIDSDKIQKSDGILYYLPNTVLMGKMNAEWKLFQKSILKMAISNLFSYIGVR